MTDAVNSYRSRNCIGYSSPLKGQSTRSGSEFQRSGVEYNIMTAAPHIRGHSSGRQEVERRHPSSLSFLESI